ncbi:MAG TPA: bifunctional 5,10-methylenetetrahydrofolate dehydrogenase/5,10-methenyltetrahydrofolate cyclohydrolase [Thermoanaerobaculia bacterium]|nr:bifunctional 5,10-methylenetetrahydrofolate dehydrogenase/5,10-methenyltetrahydrofolate cyclohydrolase [Thermoanaerobaculia bacterium]
MPPVPLDGKRIAADLRFEVAARAAELRSRGVTPGLTAVLVGEDPASAVYVKSKGKAAEEAGIESTTLRFPATLREAELLAAVDRLNRDDAVDAILVQLPLPKTIDTARILEAVDPAKDVDGFHPTNVGRLVQGKPAPRPCTPAGILEMLKREGVPLRGARAVVVGRSDIVGKPMAHLLLKEDVTVTIAHSKTRDLPGLCREADLLVAAIGKPGFVDGSFVREGAVVVDVGINRLTRVEDVNRFFPGDAARLASFEKNGTTIVGDCDPSTAFPRSSRYTPVPGGVGPLTIAMLLSNTLDLCGGRRGR